ncbi:MAG TPA: ATP-dependent sacrificial sulfur transferase LarE [candidate division Zixibacteria bacterium]|nr:ATP-dependent sacrificial sulfur transferase LarE [candidate division Zixibacteria bacterium]
MTIIKQTDTLDQKLNAIKQYFINRHSVVVAFSGGVDSTLLLRLAVEFTPGKVLAVSSKSSVSPKGEIELGAKLALELGVDHIIINTNELENPKFTANPTNRCYHCKSGLFIKLKKIGEEHGIKTVVDGTNYDDINDYRPGMQAGVELGVESPLKECLMTKDNIRTLSKQYNLYTWDKAASPCLSSRVPYNSEITLEKLLRIDKAENIIKKLGIKEVRVRDHEQIARIEIPKKSFDIFIKADANETISNQIKELGYKYVSLDTNGFRSGSLNEVLKK